MPVRHSNLIGGSTAKRRMNCIGSYQLELVAPVPPSSSYAEDGTRKHDAMELILDKGMSEIECLDHIEGLTVDDIHDAVEPALELLNDLMREYNVKDYDYVCEAEVKFQGMDAFGTVDLIVWSEKHIFIIDWKFGRGVVVDVGRDNYQLKFYGAAAMETPEFKHLFTPEREIVLAIIQPPVDQPLTHGIVSRDELESFVVDMKAAIGQAIAGEMETTPGAWCKFCNAEPMCPSKTDMVTALINRGPLDPEVPANELGALLDMAHQIESWSRAVFKLAFDELEKGRDVDGYKLVDKRGTRRWTSNDVESVLTDLLGDQAFEKKLVSPAKAEKALKLNGSTADISAHIVSTSSGRTLAAADDPRPAVTIKPRGVLNLPHQTEGL